MGYISIFISHLNICFALYDTTAPDPCGGFGLEDGCLDLPLEELKWALSMTYQV